MRAVLSAARNFSGNLPTDQERSGIVEVHKAAARYANKANIALAVEPLNRFECYALNTIADTADIVRRVDEPNYGLLYDTFHTNIEEKDPVGVISPHLKQIRTSIPQKMTVERRAKGMCPGPRPSRL